MTVTTRITPAGRDLTLDLARVFCVVLVVFVHILFTGVGVSPTGELVIERTIEAQAWFNPVSWVAQIMPLFFVVGGFAARAGWNSAQRRGDTATDFARVRLLRLARPALPLMLFFSVVLAGARFVGLDPTLVSTIAIGVGSPLWFLAAYAVVQALAPFMIRMHQHRPLLTLMALGAAAAIIDIARLGVVENYFGVERVTPGEYTFGNDFFGIPNMLFVWLFCQQLGFVMFDGWFTRRTWWQLVGLIGSAYATLWIMVPLGGYSHNMLTNQWPPTAPLAVIAIAQAAGLTLLHRPLAALMATRPMQAIVFLLGSRLMTVYLWHLPLIMVLTGVQLLLPLPMPWPGGTLWWATRPVFLIVVLGTVWALSLWVGRYERIPHGTPRYRSAAATTTALVLFTGPILATTMYGLNLELALLMFIGTSTALVTCMPRNSRTDTERIHLNDGTRGRWMIFFK